MASDPKRRSVKDGLGANVSLEEALDTLKYNEQGLIPAIAQCAETEAVLMLAWMNREAIARSIAEGRVVYWSRSRRAFWRKGDTSGHVQRLVELRIDCDADCLLLRVEQIGAACHTGRRSCFFTAIHDGRTVEIAT